MDGTAPRRGRGNGGQATLEWLGVLVVVALVIGLAVTVAPQVGQGVRCEVLKIVGSGGSGSCDTATGAPAPVTFTAYHPLGAVGLTGASGGEAGTGVMHADGGGTGCSWDDTCGHCPIQGLGYGRCSKKSLEFDVAWCGREGRARTEAYAENRANCARDATYLSRLSGNTTCDILALLAGRGVSLDTRYYLELAELSDPVVSWSSWVAGIFGSAAAKAFCK